MGTVTEKENLKQQEESRDFFCVMSDVFRIFARRSSTVLGSAWAFASAILIIVIWGLTGPTFHYSDTWQLIINPERQLLLSRWSFSFRIRRTAMAKRFI